MGVKSPRKYSEEFKRQAVDLASELGPTGAARKLGIADGNINNWRKKFGDSKRGPKPTQESADDELKRLRKKVVELEKANTILKAAAAFFSQDHLK